MSDRRLRLAAYVRVSTEGQADDGYGLQVQRQAIQRWTKANGYRVVSWFADEGVSGAREAAERTGLTSALRAVKERQVDGIVVARLDRLARKLEVQEATLAHVWNHDGRVFAVDHGEVLRDDPDDPMRTALRQMMGVFAELDRALITKRMRDGRRAKKENGGYAGGGPPYGYRAEGGELVPAEHEQLVLARIRQLRAEGAGARRIADTLNAEGLKPKRGELWYPMTVGRVLRRLS